MSTNEARALLRHTLATIAYRGGKTLRGAPAGFAGFRVAPASRTPGEILAHIGDLFDWALSVVNGKQTWGDAPPLPWDQEVARFFGTLEKLDASLTGDEPMACTPEQLFQAPIADALTHIGQLAMLRRLAGSPVRAENYFVADIAIGRVGPSQSAPRAEFG